MIRKPSIKLVFLSSILMLLILAAWFAPYITIFDPLSVSMDQVLLPPGSEHFLGTDELGRDVLTRLLYGGRVSLSVGAAAMVISLILGVIYGGISGLAGGLTDRIMMRFIDASLSIPSIILMIGLQLIFPNGLLTIILVISLTSWMTIARMIRSEILTVKNNLFIQASAVVGATQKQLFYRHILPQCWPTMTVMAISGVNHAILAEATLSFFGIGIPPHIPSWGNMLMGAQSHMLARAWWMAFFPGICIAITILLVTFLGDELQDRLSGPQFRKRGKYVRIPS